MDFLYCRAGVGKVRSSYSILFSFTNKHPFSIIIAKYLMERNCSEQVETEPCRP